MHKNSVILLTGNRGFIGQRLERLFKTNGYKVLGIDKDLCNILDKEQLEIFFEEGKPDLVIHCAAAIGRLYGEDHPDEMVQNNIQGTLNVVQLCTKYETPLINFATSEVSFELTNMYGISKMAAETVVKHYCNNYGLNAISVRPFMIYGGGQIPSKYKSALDIFVSTALKGEPLTVHKATIRAWLHVEDFARAILLLVEKYPINGFETFNIGSLDYRYMEDVAKQIIKEVGSGSMNITGMPKFTTQVKKVCFDKLYDFLEFKSTISLEAGIRELIYWHKSYQQDQL